MSIFSDLFEGAGSFFENLFKSEVTALMPVAQQSVAELAAGEIAALASGDTSQTGHILAKASKSMAAKMASAGITAAAPSIATALTAAAKGAGA